MTNTNDRYLLKGAYSSRAKLAAEHSDLMRKDTTMKKSGILLAAALALFAGTIRPAGAMTYCQGLAIEAAGYYARAAGAAAVGDYFDAGVDYVIAGNLAASAEACN